MGQISSSRIILLVVCLALTSAFIYLQPSFKAVEKEILLSQLLSDVEGWRGRGHLPMDQEIVKALELDDYVNESYSNEKGNVSLYIGYYLTAKKLAAAHSPLVCFPGAGWVISDTEQKSLTIGEYNLHLMQMIVTKAQEKQLVLYWFQAFDKTSPGTFLQKIYALWAKFLYHRGDNAFVRVSIPIEKESVKEAFGIGVEFIEAFYPRFLKYVKEGEV